LAEWSGIGLQNRVRRFESATDLNQNPLTERSEGDFLFSSPSGACSSEEGKTKKTRLPQADREGILAERLTSQRITE
jgi:hypothetical protein